MPELHDLTALDAAAAIRRREVSPVELIDHYLDRIDRLDDQIGAFVTVTADIARQQAKQAEAEVIDAADDLAPLHGVPTSIKDLQMTAGVTTKFGSPLYSDFVPPIDDHIVTLLRKAGTISLGKTATPEFGSPCYTETDIGPPARTPWDTSRLAGGSSGGAAAAVSSGFLPIAQGSDGGGSIRIPASLTGLVGLKTSRGRISRGPIDGDSSGLSVIGPLARTVRDAAAFLDVTAIPQPGDPYWAPPLAWENASRLLESLGHEVVDIDMPIPAEVIPAFVTIWTVLSDWPFDPTRERELRPVTRYLRNLGLAVSGPQYSAAIATVSRICRQSIVATSQYDAVLTPTLAMQPRPIGWFCGTADDPIDPAEDFERQKAFTPFTAVYNATGQPAISLPLHWTPDDLPVGVMLVGRPADEAHLLALAAQLEAAAPWRDRHPPIWSA